VCVGLIASVLTSGNVYGQAKKLAVGTSEADENQVTKVDLLASSDSAIQGLVMVVEWDERKARGEGVTASAVLSGAELVVSRVEDAFLIFSAVIDADGQGPDSIPAGDDQVVATMDLRCICPGFRQDVALALVDDRHARVDGGPILDNIIVSGGESFNQAGGLQLENGTLTCNPNAEGPTFLCGGPEDEQGNIPTAEGRPGETVTLCYYYQDPAPAGGKIQGFSMSVEYDCNLTCDENSVSLDNGAISAVNAEFFQLHADNDAGDGDGCEMIVGMLIDLEAAHDGRRLPATDGFSRLFCVDYTINENAEDDTCLEVNFKDGLDGRGRVATDNLVSIDFFEQTPNFGNCQICVQADLPFIRGDCNFNERVNIADAAAMVGTMFLGEFPAPCFDACDADDNGALNVSDPVYLLNYLFVFGEEPPAPFPTPGDDPTDDDPLDCSGEGAFPN